MYPQGPSGNLSEIFGKLCLKILFNSRDRGSRHDRHLYKDPFVLVLPLLRPITGILASHSENFKC